MENSSDSDVYAAVCIQDCWPHMAHLMMKVPIQLARRRLGNTNGLSFIGFGLDLAHKMGHQVIAQSSLFLLQNS